MSENGERYIFKAYTAGLTAQFHRLGAQTGLAHVIPALGTAVLPVTGGRSHSRDSRYECSITDPKGSSLVTAGLVEGRAKGSDDGTNFITVVYSKAEDVHITGRLHFDQVEVELTSTTGRDRSTTFTFGAHTIQGMRLGNALAVVEFDDDIMKHCGSRKELSGYCGNKCRDIGDYLLCSIVKQVTLIGQPEEGQITKIGDNFISWDVFGTIFLGEVLVGDKERRVTMVRLQMGSDNGGSGAIGDAGTNGSVST